MTDASDEVTTYTAAQVMAALDRVRYRVEGEDADDSPGAFTDSDVYDLIEVELSEAELGRTR